VTPTVTPLGISNQDPSETYSKDRRGNKLWQLEGQANQPAPFHLSPSAPDTMFIVDLRFSS
jgi:hypothetical protein